MEEATHQTLPCLSAFPLLLNSHALFFLPFKPILPTFILYFCLYARWLPPPDPRLRFSSIHVAIRLGSTIRLSHLHTSNRVFPIDAVVLAGVI